MENSLESPVKVLHDCAGGLSVKAEAVTSVEESESAAKTSNIVALI